MPAMTDESAETTAEVTAVDKADDVRVETVEAAGAEELTSSTGEETPELAGIDESPVLTAAKPAGRRWVPIAVAAAFAVLLGAVGALGWQVWQQHQLKQAALEAQRAAVSYAQVLTSIDSNKVDENFKDVLDGATGEFKDMYSQSSVELRQLLIENKATAHGVVVESAVQEASKNKAVVLLFVDQSVTNTKLPDPRIDRSRMKMTLEKVDGRWRASKVELP
jgi:Mce-associated membrane protein